MQVCLFISEGLQPLYGLTSRESGDNLPVRHRPWHALGRRTVSLDAAPVGIGTLRSDLERCGYHVAATAAAERVRNEFGRLDVLIQNAAISNTTRRPDQSVEAFTRTTGPSNVSLDELHAVWDTNGFGVLAVYQAMLPLLRETPGARIVKVSSGVGSLTANSDPAYAYRGIFGPVYPASKTALNALTVAMAIELEPEGIRVNAVSPGYTKTNINNYAGPETVEDGAREAVRVALAAPDGPTGNFTRWENETIPW